VNSVFLGSWLEALRPVRGKLTIPLATVFRDKDRTESEHTQATNIIADYASDDLNLIADLLLDADPKAYNTLFAIVERQAADALPLFRAEIDKKASFEESERDSDWVKDRLAQRQARAAVALFRLGEVGTVWPLLRHSADPRLRSFILNGLFPLGADAEPIALELDRLDRSARPILAQARPSMEAILFDPETSMRRALILALGTYGIEQVSADERETLACKLLERYRNDPDSGIHGAAEWTLRQWRQDDRIKQVDTELLKHKDRRDRRWFVNSQGQTFTVIHGPNEFLMGSPPTEPDHLDNEILHRRSIPYRFAIATREATVEQYQHFVERFPAFGLDASSLKRWSPEPTGPMIAVSWCGAAAYCNWLSEKEGLPQSQWCYVPNQAGAYTEGMTVPADVLRRTGYRLPTEAEWEYACRAATRTGRYYGSANALVGSYAWHQANCGEHARAAASLMPNDLGLFDMLGNAYEWCQNRYQRYPTDISFPTVEKSDPPERLLVAMPRVLRGGSILGPMSYARSAHRTQNAPNYRHADYGFRLARTLQ
jgi:formylglycine-generating enzyme required for sulfatase activity